MRSLFGFKTKSVIVLITVLFVAGFFAIYTSALGKSESLSSDSSMGTLGNLGNLGTLGNLGNLGTLGNLGNLGHDLANSIINAAKDKVKEECTVNGGSTVITSQSSSSSSGSSS